MDHFCQKYEINYIHPSTENLVLRGNGGSHSPHTEGKWTTSVRNVIFINYIQHSKGNIVGDKRYQLTTFTFIWKGYGECSGSEIHILITLHTGFIL